VRHSFDKGVELRLCRGMTIAHLFWFLVIASCAYAACLGGWEGRWFAIVYVSQTILTSLVWLIDRSWSNINLPTLAVDLLLLVALWSIAARSRRYWPLWVFGFHLITMSAHLASLLAGAVPFKAYFFLANMWAAPKLLVVIVGIVIDRRAGLPPPRGPVDRRHAETHRPDRRRDHHHPTAAA
jgi:hypothetical protein